jgi:hypothetical protein
MRSPSSLPTMPQRAARRAWPDVLRADVEHHVGDPWPEGSMCGPVSTQVAVVDGQHRPAADPRDQVAPRGIPGRPDLDPCPDGQVVHRPVLRAPRDLLVRRHLAELLLTRHRVDDHHRHLPRRHPLGHGARHDVEPLVRHDEHVGQAVELGWQRTAARRPKPRHGIRDAVGPAHDVDPGESQVGSGFVQVRQQFSTATADVDDVRGTLTVGQVGDGLGEHDAQSAVGRRREVTRRPLGATVEPGLAVERVVPRLPPRDHHARTVPRRTSALAGTVHDWPAPPDVQTRARRTGNPALARVRGRATASLHVQRRTQPLRERPFEHPTRERSEADR